VDLEKHLERLEGSIKGLWIGLAAGLAVAGLACVLSLVALFLHPTAAANSSTERPPSSERQELTEQQRKSYLDELERLEVLKTKGAITQQEFDAKKQQLLAAAPPPVPSKSGDIDELDKLLRDVYALYNKSTITGVEYQSKKQQYLQRPITVTNLTKDLEKVQKLYDENILVGTEYQTLKQKVLAADPANAKK
jgi:hypothetical protein